MHIDFFVKTDVSGTQRIKITVKTEVVEISRIEIIVKTDMFAISDIKIIVKTVVCHAPIMYLTCFHVFFHMFSIWCVQIIVKTNVFEILGNATYVSKAENTRTFRASRQKTQEHPGYPGQTNVVLVPGCNCTFVEQQF